MADFKFVVSDPKTKKSYQLTISQDKAYTLIGKKIKDKFDGSIIGLSGYELEITGGTDKDGFPMLPSIQGPVRKKIILSGRPGFKPRLKGQRKRKTVRGNTISADITQINTKIVKYGSKPLEEIFKKEEKTEG
ncbi:MAG: 30S ribosomal protein S6e [Candidatus Aenigmatarchaeota archaeon]